MALTIGYDSATGIAAYIESSTNAQGMLDKADVIGVLPVGEKFTTLGLYSSSQVATMEVGIYDITGGVNGAVLIAATTIVSSGVLMDRHTVAIAPVGVEGNTYAMGYRVVGDDQRIMGLYSNGGLSLSNTLMGSQLDATFDDSATNSSVSRAIFAISEIVATPSITLTAPDTVTHGTPTTATGTNLATVTGMSLKADTGWLISQTFVENAGALDFTPNTNFGITAGNVASTVPFTDATLAAGCTAYTVDLEVTDE